MFIQTVALGATDQILRKRSSPFVAPAPSIVGDVLVLARSLYGASVNTTAAADALVSVDYVLAVTLGDCFNGACISASAASNAIIGDFVSHGVILL